MAQRDEIRIPAKDEPTFLNKEALIGFLFFNVPGAILGSLIGKERMQRESRDGKIVSEPTIWNKDMALGAGVGAFLMSAGAIIGALTGGLGGFIGGAIGTVAIGALIGGSIGKSRMEEEYQEALNIRARERSSAQPELANGLVINAPAYTRSVSQQEAAALDARTKQGGTGLTQFAEQIEQARKQPTPTVPQV